MLRTRSFVFNNDSIYGSNTESESRTQQLNSCRQAFESDERIRRKKAVIVLAIVVILQNITEYGFAINITDLSRKIWNTYNHMGDSEGLFSVHEKPLDANYGIIATAYYLLLAFFSVFGGYLGDGRMGRLKAICFSLGLSIAGSIIFFILEILSVKKAFVAYHRIFLALFMICISLFAAGSGIHCSNIIPFGAEQVMNIPTDSMRLLAMYVAHGYYFMRNVGCAIAFSGVSYLQTDGSHSCKVAGYSIPFLASSISLLVIVVPSSIFVQQLPQHNMTKKFFRILKEGYNLSRVPNILSVTQLTLLDYSRTSYGGSFADSEVDAVQSILRLIPKFSLFVVYFALYSQMHTTFFVQGSYIDPQVRNVNIELVDNIIILVLIPLFVCICYIRQERVLSFFTNLQIGFSLISFSMISAGFLEYFRKNGDAENAKLHFYCRFPQYIFLGVSEIFAVIAGFEMTIINAPKIFRSIAFGIYFMFSALGILVSGIIFISIRVITPKATRNKGWLSNDLDMGHLYYFFYLLSFLMVLNMIFLIFYSRSSTLVTNHN